MAGLLSDEELIDELYGPNADTVDADVYRRFGLTPNLKRGTVLPIARDEQGNLTPAVPQAIIDFLKAVSLPGHVVRGGQYTPQDVREMAANVGLLGSVATKPAGALTSGLARNAAELPMDEASRIARVGDGWARAGAEVDGRIVRKDVPNMGSISASFEKYEVLPGVREVPMSVWGDAEHLAALRGRALDARTQRLADEIAQNREINPLIVAIDDEGPYILEGGHRFAALIKNGAKSFPAVVVRDNTEWGE